MTSFQKICGSTPHSFSHSILLLGIRTRSISSASSWLRDNERKNLRRAWLALFHFSSSPPKTDARIMTKKLQFFSTKLFLWVLKNSPLAQLSSFNHVFNFLVLFLERNFLLDLLLLLASSSPSPVVPPQQPNCCV